MQDHNLKLRKDITALCKRINSGKIKCRCGGTLKMQVEQGDGRACNESAYLYCSREACPASTRWHPGFELLEAFKEWKRMQPRIRRPKVDSGSMK